MKSLINGKSAAILLLVGCVCILVAVNIRSCKQYKPEPNYADSASINISKAETASIYVKEHNDSLIKLDSLHIDLTLIIDRQDSGLFERYVELLRQMREQARLDSIRKSEGGKSAPRHRFAL